jgi:hypothetical protein
MNWHKMYVVGSACSLLNELILTKHKLNIKFCQKKIEYKVINVPIYLCKSVCWIINLNLKIKEVKILILT